MSFLKDLRKINPLADKLEDSTIGNISGYISTGSLLLNAFISGSLFKGVPMGRVMSYEGLSGVGKSLVAATTIREAQKMGIECIWLDTEKATDKNFAKNLGVDTTELNYLPSGGCIEDVRNELVKIFDLIESDDEYRKKEYALVIDSLGNIPSAKSIADAQKGKTATDMGQRAKAIRDLFRVITPYLTRLDNLTLIVINHVYKDSSSLYGATIVSGGEGGVYNPTVSVVFGKGKVPESAANKKVTIGTYLKPYVTKNRIAPPFKRGDILIHFTEGMNKYYGLLPIGVETGLIIKDGKKYRTKYFAKDKKSLFEAKIYTDEFFEPILQEMDEKFSTIHCYSTTEQEINQKLLVETEIIEEEIEDEDE